MFNRGTTNAGLFGEVERLVGDRNGDLSALTGRSWDAVIDTSGYLPRTVRSATRALRGAAGAYVLRLHHRVYAETDRVGCDERSGLRQLAEETDDLGTEDDVRYYGALKVLCEQAVTAAFGDAGVILRPGPIVGPHDPTDRFTYWPRRAACRGGGPSSRAPRTAWCSTSTCATSRAARCGWRSPPVGGPLNVVVSPYRFSDFLTACDQVAGAATEWIWAEETWPPRAGGDRPLGASGVATRGPQPRPAGLRRPLRWRSAGCPCDRWPRPSPTRWNGTRSDHGRCTGGLSAAAIRSSRSRPSERPNCSACSSEPHDSDHGDARGHELHARLAECVGVDAAGRARYQR